MAWNDEKRELLNLSESSKKINAILLRTSCTYLDSLGAEYYHLST